MSKDILEESKLSLRSGMRRKTPGGNIALIEFLLGSYGGTFYTRIRPLFGYSVSS